VKPELQASHNSDVGTILLGDAMVAAQQAHWNQFDEFVMPVIYTTNLTIQGHIFNTQTFILRWHT
jgi:hypothetical protein